MLLLVRAESELAHPRPCVLGLPGVSTPGVAQSSTPDLTPQAPKGLILPPEVGASSYAVGTACAACRC